MNKGEIRVGIGSTEMLGTGVNAQQRAVAVHHLDVTWTYKDIIQRDGRAVRKNNWVAKEHNNNTVQSYVYATEKSLDAYKFDCLATKIKFIGQIKKGDISVRTLDEGGIDQHTGMSQKEFSAILSGDSTILDKAKLDGKIMQLRNEQTSFYKQIEKREDSIKSINEEISKHQKIISNLNQDKNCYDSIPRNEKGEIVFKIQLASVTIDESDKLTLGKKEIEYTDITKAGIALNSIAEVPNKDNLNLTPIGKFYDFTINIKSQISLQSGTTYQVLPNMKISFI